ncbi:Acyl-CoA dehydrogenase, short-chain specific [Achromobacter denitrificans]|uniref:acyl-CoA dehydrogenase family protein n=1 Tax=Achromobacter denitrificans TaxID=32002 RepID=UPI00078831A1|nr:acyl-CoA dehydrogenase family protein [Achromobacter denitrificans]OLU05080.1 acyl-CoA dehydrogenase [Achromobacter denitrificans]QKH43630.1 acyl-CoA dehydrogenase family protein [Achromobacter denitrificans]QKH49229.1 acyl-CoA dehydrogenase family protein [Achromobacter denitrificans]CAB3737518.1 Acyl-CoA dehydrogenase [Achromobacter denitrificans]SUU12061.1 Acyl-CoA dehydrogenase, short-chain specific [Achromobacter denitrificans]
MFTHEHIALQDGVRQLIEKEINPYLDQWEDAEIFPAHDVFKKLGKAGYLGVNKPVEFGGMGLDYSYEIAFCEAIGSVRAGGVGMAIAVQTDMATPALARFGNDSVREQFLRPSIAGDYVACLGVSETGAGSDVASLKTTARKDGDDYVISGSKMWITNATQADWMCLLANTSDGKPHRNKSLICVPLKQDNGQPVPGVTMSRIKKVGMWSSDTAQVFFDEVRVPQRYRIGEEGMGFTYQMRQFQEERLSGATRRVTALSDVINDTIDYTRQRQVFGKPLLDNQAVHFRLAELKTEVEMLRSLVYRAAGVHMEGGDMTELASMAKLKAGRLCREVTDSCLQYWGGMGFTLENAVSRAWRDLRLISIGGGADEVMLTIICKHMGILPARAA